MSTKDLFKEREEYERLLNSSSKHENMNADSEFWEKPKGETC